MAILTGTNRTEKKPAMSANTISPAMHQQIQGIIESGAGNGSVSSQTAEKKKKKRDNSDTLLLKLPKGERQAFKTWCASHGTDMTSFIYACMDFVRFHEAEGIIQVSKGGVKLLKQNIIN